MKLRMLAAGALCSLLVTGTLAEERQHTLSGRAITGPSSGRTVTSQSGSLEARQVVARIIAAIGLPATNFDVRSSAEVDYAQAVTEKRGERVILYNPSWMDGLRVTLATNWSDWFVLAHEVGHHIAFHMDPAFPNHEAELQADYFAGFILNKLGAPLPEVQLAIAMVAADEATETHPAKSARVAEVRKGWEAAARHVGANVLPATFKVPDQSTVLPAASAEQRIALLIGNTHYKSWGTALKNPKNDVIAVGRQLRQLGFQTTVIYDGTSEQISTAISAFKDESKTADWAIIYYAGTGIEVDGVNYMIPIEADDRRALSFTREFPQMRLDTAFEAVKGAKKLRLVITDACRIDPETTLAGIAKPKRLKVTEPPRGVLVAYSTAAGEFASDGNGTLSPFAQSFVDAIREPGIELPKVFRRVTAVVETETQGRQSPTVLGNWPDLDLIVSPK